MKPTLGIAIVLLLFLGIGLYTFEHIPGPSPIDYGRPVESFSSISSSSSIVYEEDHFPIELTQDSSSSLSKISRPLSSSSAQSSSSSSSEVFVPRHIPIHGRPSSSLSSIWSSISSSSSASVASSVSNRPRPRQSLDCTNSTLYCSSSSH